MKRLTRQQRCRPKQGMEPSQKHTQAQREGQSYILFAYGRMGTAWLRQQKSRRKESL